ncbi:fibronectin type III domain-containing protein 7-like [Clarias gariepinus]|uniref:fibronectin type III domain-containing protein 7-like n=1 Tax=Clarias gariepinus TaxID=13013 RepID=UPI00234C431E|nr:fibronectin type III domain-containing protein 7-like [Clarias gariepinus]
MVQWHPNGGAESYEVQALGSRGDIAGCNTTGMFCNMSNLLCGDVYNVSVFAISNNCRVTGNLVTQLRTVPCVPVPLNPVLDCASGEVTMKWQSSSGATSYRALAKGSGGYPASCSSNSTTCVFAGLLCGLTYSFSVSASDSMCTSMYSSSFQLNTVPCKPQNLSASVDCSTSTGLVSWEAEQGALFYMVQAVGANGYQTQCMSTNTSCSLPSLQCGQLYNVTSVSQDGRCNSSSAQVNLQSVPCVPTGVKASLLCSSNSVAVTWQSSSGALRYRADAVNINRSQTVSCNSSLPSCTVGQLLCGTSYNVTVVALDDECSSVKSLAAQVLSGEEFDLVSL